MAIILIESISQVIKGAAVIAFLLLVLVSEPSSALATVFVWHDSAGVAHYANKGYEIPERYRAKAKVLYPEQGDTAAQQQVVPSVQAPPPVPVQQAKPEAPALVDQTSITPKYKNILPDRETRKKRRSREETEE
jgi:hypothetical protein